MPRAFAPARRSPSGSRATAVTRPADHAGQTETLWPRRWRSAIVRASKRDSSARDFAAKARGKSAGRGGAANSAFMKPMQPDNALAQVVGDSPIPRSEVTKRVWAYIKKNGLQDAKNRRNINADDKLKPVFGGKKTVSMFEMTKLVSKHLK